MPIAAVNAENRIVSSYDGTMNVVQLASGRPPMFNGYSITEAQYLEREAGRHAGEAAGENQLRQHGAGLVDDGVEILDRDGRIGLDPRESLRHRLARRIDQRLAGVVLGHHAVHRWRCPWCVSHQCSAFTLPCGSSVLTSNIEIIGTKRRNSRNAVVNRPNVPAYSKKSHIVGE